MGGINNLNSQFKTNAQSIMEQLKKQKKVNGVTFCLSSFPFKLLN